MTLDEIEALIWTRAPGLTHYRDTIRRQAMDAILSAVTDYGATAVGEVLVTRPVRARASRRTVTHRVDEGRPGRSWCGFRGPAEAMTRDTAAVTCKICGSIVPRPPVMHRASESEPDRARCGRTTGRGAVITADQAQVTCGACQREPKPKPAVQRPRLPEVRGDIRIVHLLPPGRVDAAMCGTHLGERTLTTFSVTSASCTSCRRIHDQKKAETVQ